MKKLIVALSLAALPSLAHAATPTTTVDNGTADKAVHAALNAGTLIPCIGDTSSCTGREMSYRIFYGPDQKTAVVWAFGYPSEGTVHMGLFAEFKDENGWKLAKVFKKPIVDSPAPEEKDIIFLSPNRVQVTYHYKKDTDANCCSTGIGKAILALQ